MALTDQQVAQFLTDFRDRTEEEQQNSPVWQELVQFPGWGMASYSPKKKAVKPTEAPPDPRLPAHERAAVLKAQGGVTDDAKAKAPASGSMTTALTRPQQNPWAMHKIPAPGPAFLSLKTEVPPPFPGSWRRTPDGWFRES